MQRALKGLDSSKFAIKRWTCHVFLQIFLTEKKRNLSNHGLFEGCWQVFLVISVMENKLIDHPSSFLPLLGTLGTTRSVLWDPWDLGYKGICYKFVLMVRSVSGWLFKILVYPIGTPHVWPAKKKRWNSLGNELENRADSPTSYAPTNHWLIGSIRATSPTPWAANCPSETNHPQPATRNRKERFIKFLSPTLSQIL